MTRKILALTESRGSWQGGFEQKGGGGRLAFTSFPVPSLLVSSHLHTCPNSPVLKLAPQVDYRLQSGWASCSKPSTQGGHWSKWLFIWVRGSFCVSEEETSSSPSVLRNGEMRLWSHLWVMLGAFHSGAGSNLSPFHISHDCLILGREIHVKEVPFTTLGPGEQRLGILGR